MKDVMKTCRSVSFRAVISTVTAMALLFTSVLSGFGEIKANAATVITTQAQLADIANNLSGNYELGCDIDLGGTEWTPIGAPILGTSDNFIHGGAFTGTFNGNGHKITGLSIQKNQKASGLFGYVNGATIENVAVSGSVTNDDSNTYYYYQKTGIFAVTGGLAGLCIGSTIKNCSSRVSVSGNYTILGGLLGVAYSCRVVNCYATGNVTDKYLAGGFAPAAAICGGLIGINAGTVYNCYATGTLIYNDYCDEESTVGGLLGEVDVTPDNSTSSVSCCYALNHSTNGNIPTIPLIGNAVEAANAYMSTCPDTCKVYASASDMQSTGFLNLLNSNYRSDTTDTGLKAWVAGSSSVNNGYPLFKTYVTGITVTGAGSAVSFKSGGSLQMSAAVLPSDATNPAVTWSVAVKSGTFTADSITTGGLLSATGSGVLTVTATAADGSGIKGSTDITVAVATVSVTGVTMDLASKTLTVGDSATLVATVAPSDATNKKVNWSSSDESVATVDATGKVTAVKAGTATITATTEDGNFSASCTVTVSEPTPTTVSVAGVSLDAATKALTVGDSATLAATIAPSDATNKKVNWSSSDESVATVDATGKVTAVKAGTATITATTEDGNYTATCTITVNAPTPTTVSVTGVSLDAVTKALTVGDSATLAATAAPSDATNKKVNWSSTDESVATVDTTGKVTAVKAGTATITATTEDGNFSASCTVTVGEPTPTTVNVTGVSLDAVTKALTVGDSTTLVATVAPSDATNKKVNWSSSDESVATVDTTGKVTAVSAGTATITVTADDGSKTATCNVTVTAANTAPGITGPTSLSLTEGYSATSTGAFTIKGTEPVTVTKTSGNDAITWNSTTNKLDIAAGLVAGTYTVTLKASNGTSPDATATFTLTVSTAPPPTVTLDSIAITKSAAKTVYTVGDSLDLSGLEITGTYSDRSTKTESITEANVTGFDSSKPAASQRLTVTVGGKTATYTVVINAKEETGSGVISAFSSLADSVKTQTVTLGTAISTLPQKLKAVVDGISNTFVSVVNWVSNITYNPNIAGTYDFTPVLDSGYQLKDSGVQLPHITVKVVAGGNSSSSSGSKSSSEKPASSSSTQTDVNTASNTAVVSTVADSTAVNGNTAEITATVPTVTTDTTGTSASIDTGKKASVEINLPKDSIVEQLSAKRDVALTVTVPSDVTANRNANLAVDIKVDSDIFDAAKTAQSDVTVNIRDAGTQQVAYSWTFKGEDLAKSTVPVTNVNIAMSVHSTAEMPPVSAAAPNHSGVVLSFEHSGVLPAVASVRVSVAGEGYQPGQTLYFYYFNPATQRIEPLDDSAYTVDTDGYVTVKISHCSNYVLLPQAARFLTLDTRNYTMAPNGSYVIGVKRTGKDGHLSLCIDYENGLYKSWYATYSGLLCYSQSRDAHLWSASIRCSVPLPVDYQPYHQDIIHSNSGYYLLQTAEKKENYTFQLFLFHSKDGIHFTSIRRIYPNSNKALWKNISFYRSTLFLTGDRLNLYISLILPNWNWYVTKTEIPMK